MSGVSPVAGMRWWNLANPRLTQARYFGHVEPVTFTTCPVCWTDTALSFHRAGGADAGTGTWVCRACRLELVRAELVANAVRVATWRMLARRQAARLERPWISTHAGYCVTPLGTGCGQRSIYNGKMIHLLQLGRYL